MNFFKRVWMNFFSFIEFIWYGLKNNLLDFSRLADLLKKKQPFTISGRFQITTLKEEYEQMSDYLVKLVTPQAQSEHKDIVKWGVDVAIDGEPQETRFSLEPFELRAKEAASVSLKIVAWDNTGNQSVNTVEETVVWVDDVSPTVTGNFKIESVREEFEDDAPEQPTEAPAPIEEPAPVVDETPATEPVNEEPAPVVEETQPVEEPAAETEQPVEESSDEVSEGETEPATEDVAPEVVEESSESTEAPTESVDESVEESAPVEEATESTEPAAESTDEPVEEAGDETSFPVEGSEEAEKPAE